jgi:hypothetical protein
VIHKLFKFQFFIQGIEKILLIFSHKLFEGKINGITFVQINVCNNLQKLQHLEYRACHVIVTQQIGLFFPVSRQGLKRKTQVCLKLAILLLLPPKCWNYMHMLSCLALTNISGFFFLYKAFFLCGGFELRA